MKKVYEYSNDKDFLEQINNEHLKERYVKITILNWLEEPIQEIQGIVTGGNLNLDGNSNVRRTTNLSCYIDKVENANVTNLDNLFSINKKMFLEIGYLNMTDKYVENKIIWFPQGTFVMITPSLSHSTGGVSLQVSLRDKMCLLNGECGGVISASTQFDQYETIDEDGNWVISKPTMEQIVRELVNHFGGEQLGKIIISHRFIDESLRMRKIIECTDCFDSVPYPFSVPLEEFKNRYFYLPPNQFSLQERFSYDRLIETFGGNVDDLNNKTTHILFKKEQISQRTIDKMIKDSNKNVKCIKEGYFTDYILLCGRCNIDNYQVKIKSK